MGVEITTVGDDMIVVHADGERIEMTGLDPDTDYEVAGEIIRTMRRPPGELRSRIATVNDLHLGETVAGIIGDGGPGPLLSAEPGEAPYPEVTNRAAADEIAATTPDLVVAKGDLTDAGRAEELALFHDIWVDRFAERMVWIPGNHDMSGLLACAPVAVRDLPGVRVVVVDTARPRQSGGDLDGDQIDAIDDACAGTDEPVMIFAHHPLHGPWLESSDGPSFLLQPDPSERVTEICRRRPNVLGWFAGHTHRNLRRTIDGSAAVAVEVASVKEFPGAWAEYKVFDGGVVQVVHRVQEPAAVAWCERTRSLFRGFFASFALGSLDDRCFVLNAEIVRSGAPVSVGAVGDVGRASRKPAH